MADQTAQARSQIDLVVDRFGSIAEVHRHTGFPYTTIQGWQRTGWVPARHHHAVLQAAKRAGVSLTAEELVHPWRADPRQPVAVGRTVST